MTVFIPVLYICLAGHCEFLQQLTVYQDVTECKEALSEKAAWYRENTEANVDTSCISAPPKGLEQLKPKTTDV